MISRSRSGGVRAARLAAWRAPPRASAHPRCSGSRRSSTSCSGVMSHSSFHSGLPSRFAHRSQTALTSAAVARWMTPFSGPSQRSCVSPVRLRQNPRMSPMIDSSVRPTISGASAWIAATHTSVPRPIVKVRPCPSSPSPDRCAGPRTQPSSRDRVHRVRAVEPARGRKTNIAGLEAHDRRGGSHELLNLTGNNPTFRS